MDDAAIAAICGAVAAVCTVLNNFMTWQAGRQAKRNAEALVHLHDCVESHSENIVTLIKENTDASANANAEADARHVGLRSGATPGGPDTGRREPPKSL